MIIHVEDGFINTDHVVKIDIHEATKNKDAWLTVHMVNRSEDYSGKDKSVIEKVYRHLSLLDLDKLIHAQPELLAKATPAATE